MNENIITLSPFTHNVPENDEPIPAICNAPCPRCGGCVGWHEPDVVCPTCGTEWFLTPAQADEFTLAILGLNELHIDLFLQAIDRESGSPPPALLYPASRPTWRTLDCFPSLVVYGCVDWASGLTGAAA